MLARWLFASASLALLGCGPKTLSCTAGEESVCICAGGADGVQTCLPGGRGFTPCDCSGPDTSTDVIEDTTTDGGEDALPDPPYDGPCRDDGDCNDGLFCNGQERCDEGTCIDGDPVVCDDSDPCTTDRCSEVERDCVFEAKDADGDGFIDEACGGDDCDDARDDVYPDALETSCYDDLDQDCRGVTGPQPMIDDVTLPVSGPALPAWTGSTFGIVLDDGFTVLDVDGAAVGASTALAAHAFHGPAPVWTGSTFGVVWTEDTGGAPGHFALLDAAGTLVGSTLEVASDVTGRPGIAWTGSEFAVMWNGSHPASSTGWGLVQQKVSADGALTGPDVLCDEHGGNVGGMAWTGDTLFVMRMQDTFISAIKRYDLDGTDLGALSDIPADATCTRFGENCMAFGGSTMAIVYQEGMDGTFLHLHSADGTRLGSQILEAPADHIAVSPTVTWTGSAFVTAWWDRSPAAVLMQVRPFGPDGTPLASTATVETFVTPPMVDWMGFAAAGDEFSWRWEAGGSQGMFNRVGWCR